MARNITFAPGEFYHLYNRGTEKRNIFTSKADYDRFLSLLYLCNSTKRVHLQLQGSTLKNAQIVTKVKPLVDIVAYCLMPNHFHLLVREVEEGAISRFMQKLITGYTMYFNLRHERTGALFQGKFKATHATDDIYLNYLVAYMHLNPVKLIDPAWKENGIANRNRAQSYLARYRYSSYLDYIGEERIEQIVLTKDALPTHFEKETDFKKSITEWLNFKVEP